MIDPMHPLTNYKLLDDIAMEIARNLKIQQQQDLLAEMWKPHMENLDAMFTDATCYESEMRYLTGPKILWEGIETTRKMTRCLLELLSKILKEIRRIERENGEAGKMLTDREKNDINIITTMFRQQKKHFQNKDCRESIPNRIVSISKPYVRPIVRG